MAKPVTGCYMEKRIRPAGWRRHSRTGWKIIRATFISQEMESGCYMVRISLSGTAIMIQRRFWCGMHSDMGCLTQNLLMGT